MSNTAVGIFCSVSGAIFLFIGLRWGFIGTRGGTVTRQETPILFWLAMGINAFLFLVGLFILITTH